MNSLYVLIEVGCLECGEDSKVLGVYHVKEWAERAFEEAVQKNRASAAAERIGYSTSPGVVALFPDTGSGRGRIQLLEWQQHTVSEDVLDHVTGV